MKYFVIGFFAIGIGLLAWKTMMPASEAIAENIVDPVFSAQATSGLETYDKNCRSCHGIKGSGSENGPPLIHDIYNPGHHSDGAFYAAAKNGSKQHHWQFGDMPPQSHLTNTEIANIVRYIRELQEANGIFYKQHQM